MVVATPTAVSPPGAVEGPVGSVISATSDMAEMGFDPPLDNSSNVKPFFDEMYLYGIMHAPNGELIGGAATKWEVSPDQFNWVYTVREDVKFHKGDTLTPEDFSWSWNRQIMSPEAESSAAVAWSPRVEYIRAEGNTVVVRTKEPEPLMPLWWPSYGGSQAGVVLYKAEFDRTGVEGIRNNPVGAGSFKFVERLPGRVRQAGSFRGPLLLRARVSTADCPRSPGNCRPSGTFEDGRRRSDRSRTRGQTGPGKGRLPDLLWCGATSSAIWFPYQNIEGSPFYDKRVREAFNIAIDRESISDRLYAGEGGPSPSFFSRTWFFRIQRRLARVSIRPGARQAADERGGVR